MFIEIAKKAKKILELLKNPELNWNALISEVTSLIDGYEKEYNASTGKVGTSEEQAAKKEIKDVAKIFIEKAFAYAYQTSSEELILIEKLISTAKGRCASYADLKGIKIEFNFLTGTLSYTEAVERLRPLYVRARKAVDLDKQMKVRCERRVGLEQKIEQRKKAAAEKATRVRAAKTLVREFIKTVLGLEKKILDALDLEEGAVNLGASEKKELHDELHKAVIKTLLQEYVDLSKAFEEREFSDSRKAEVNDRVKSLIDTYLSFAVPFVIEQLSIQKLDLDAKLKSIEGVITDLRQIVDRHHPADTEATRNFESLWKSYADYKERFAHKDKPVVTQSGKAEGYIPEPVPSKSTAASSTAVPLSSPARTRTPSVKRQPQQRFVSELEQYERMAQQRQAWQQKNIKTPTSDLPSLSDFSIYMMSIESSPNDLLKTDLDVIENILEEVKKKVSSHGDRTVIMERVQKVLEIPNSLTTVEKLEVALVDAISSIYKQDYFAEIMLRIKSMEKQFGQLDSSTKKRVQAVLDEVCKVITQWVKELDAKLNIADLSLDRVNQFISQYKSCASLAEYLKDNLFKITIPLPPGDFETAKKKINGHIKLIKVLNTLKSISELTADMNVTIKNKKQLIKRLDGNSDGNNTNNFMLQYYDEKIKKLKAHLDRAIEKLVKKYSKLPANYHDVLVSPRRLGFGLASEEIFHQPIVYLNTGIGQVASDAVVAASDAATAVSQVVFKKASAAKKWFKTVVLRSDDTSTDNINADDTNLDDADSEITASVERTIGYYLDQSLLQTEVANQCLMASCEARGKLLDLNKNESDFLKTIIGHLKMTVPMQSQLSINDCVNMIKNVLQNYIQRNFQQIFNTLSSLGQKEDKQREAMKKVIQLKVATIKALVNCISEFKDAEFSLRPKFGDDPGGVKVCKLERWLDYVDAIFNGEACVKQKLESILDSVNELESCDKQKFTNIIRTVLPIVNFIKEITLRSPNLLNVTFTLNKKMGQYLAEEKSLALNAWLTYIDAAIDKKLEKLQLTRESIETTISSVKQSQPQPTTPTVSKANHHSVSPASSPTNRKADSANTSVVPKPPVAVAPASSAPKKTNHSSPISQPKVAPVSPAKGKKSDVSPQRNDEGPATSRFSNLIKGLAPGGQ